MTPSEPPADDVVRAFAEYFRPWAISLPGEAVRRRADGNLRARGWMVRWRWRGDGGLDVRAAHRMTNERRHTIRADGSLSRRDVPPGMMILPPGRDREEVEAEYRQAWRRHGEAVRRDRMEFDLSRAPDFDGEAEMAFRLDGGEWQTAPLPPRPGPRRRRG